MSADFWLLGNVRFWWEVVGWGEEWSAAGRKPTGELCDLSGFSSSGCISPLAQLHGTGLLRCPLLSGDPDSGLWKPPASLCLSQLLLISGWLHYLLFGFQLFCHPTNSLNWFLFEKKIEWFPIWTPTVRKKQLGGNQVYLNTFKW